MIGKYRWWPDPWSVFCLLRSLSDKTSKMSRTIHNVTGSSTQCGTIVCSTLVDRRYFCSDTIWWLRISKLYINWPSRIGYSKRNLWKKFKESIDLFPWWDLNCYQSNLNLLISIYNVICQDNNSSVRGPLNLTAVQTRNSFHLSLTLLWIRSQITRHEWWLLVISVSQTKRFLSFVPQFLCIKYNFFWSCFNFPLF